MALETFRKEQIGGVKENKKLFYKKTAKYCQAQERCLAMSSKRPDNAVREVSSIFKYIGVCPKNYFNSYATFALVLYFQCIWRYSQFCIQLKGG